MKRLGECSVGGCVVAVNARNLCHKHYKRFMKYGDPLVSLAKPARKTREYIEQTHVVDENGCWLWTGPVLVTGYGNASRKNRTVSAHRMSYAEFVGPIPEGLLVRHKCDVRKCVNPEHLELGTWANNNRDTALRGRTGNAKLLNEDVFDIRWAYGLGASGRALARAYDVTPTTISGIVNNRSRLAA